MRTEDWVLMARRDKDALVAEKILGKDMRTAPEHDWERLPNGEIDLAAFDADPYPHNGPRCRRCGYVFCHHCEGEKGYTAQPCRHEPAAYTHDIAAARRVEDEIGRRELQEAYLTHLGALLGFDWNLRHTIWTGTEELWTLLRATPMQRCLAALRAVGAIEP